jgi:hypothetical protein
MNLCGHLIVLKSLYGVKSGLFTAYLHIPSQRGISGELSNRAESDDKGNIAAPTMPNWGNCTGRLDAPKLPIPPKTSK